MRLLICGDPHLNYGEPGSAGRRAVTEAFKESLVCAVKNSCDYWIHTGDGVDGPVRKPDLLPRERSYVTKMLQWAMEQGVTPLMPPDGNHDIPKVIDPDRPWVSCFRQIIESISPCRTHPQVHTLSFSPLGQEGAQASFDQMNLNRGGFQLIIAHMLREGVHEYISNRTETHENWFMDAWRKTLDVDTTVILGHDHTPYDAERLHVVGSPVAMDFGDEHPRRFLIWDSSTNAIYQQPVVAKIKQKLIKSYEEFAELDMDEVERVKLSFQVHSEEERKRIRATVQGKEVVDQVRMANDAFNTVLEGSLVDRWKQSTTNKNVLRRGIEVLREVGA